ncbi:MAG TPA: radical SAM protein, partial [Armatimonadota bacterium]
MHRLHIGPFVRSMREAPLSLTTLAALTPPDVELTLVDESIDRIPLDAEADLVAISVITGCAPRAYELAAHFRGRGIPVVLGGVHVTILPG